MVSSPSWTHLHLPLLTTHAVPYYSRMHEVKRLQAVRRYEVLATPPDGTYDRITALAARWFKVPIAIVSRMQVGYGLSSTNAIKYNREGGNGNLACTSAAWSEFAQHPGRRYSYRSRSNPPHAAQYLLKG
jgi:eukaryotic-like serine/threonine-protein kinase